MFGVKVGDLKPVLRPIKGNQKLALELYATGNSDAMDLAGLAADGSLIRQKEFDYLRGPPPPLAPPSQKGAPFSYSYSHSGSYSYSYSYSYSCSCSKPKPKPKLKLKPKPKPKLNLIGPPSTIPIL
jgi:hypothetical protein